MRGHPHCTGSWSPLDTSRSSEQRVQSVPPLHVSRFQMGTVCLRVSMQNCAAANASARWGVDATTTTDTSPTSSLPTRWSSTRRPISLPALSGGSGHPCEPRGDLLDVRLVFQPCHTGTAIGVVTNRAAEGHDPAAPGEDRPPPRRLDRQRPGADADPVTARRRSQLG